MKKIVALIYGGDSSEVEISIKSGKHMARHLDREKYEVFEILIRGRDWGVQMEDGRVFQPSALSRRVAALQKAGLLETRKVHKIARDAKADRRSLALRITPEGVKRIEPVYERYAELCGRLLEDLGSDGKRTVLQVNERLMEKARWGA